MAIINSMAVGKARRSMGNITYSTQQGRTIGRAKPSNVHNPNTPAQQRQRSKMYNVVRVWRLAGSTVGKLFTVRKKYSSPYNQFTSQNLVKEGILTFNPELDRVDISEGLVLGNGRYPVGSLSIERLDPGTFEVKVLSPLINQEKKVGDVVGFVAYVESTQEFRAVEVTLAANDFDGYNDIMAVELEVDFIGITMVAPYFYSPANKASSSAVLEAIS